MYIYAQTKRLTESCNQEWSGENLIWLAFMDYGNP